jgi:hypothetical protein
MDFNEFRAPIDNLELGWTNRWCFEDNRQKLLKMKEQAFWHKQEYLKNGYDVVDIYKQLDEFNNCIKQQNTITDDPEEAIILAALEYALQLRPIICSSLNKSLYELNEIHTDKRATILHRFRYQFDVYKELICFYFSYKDKIDYFTMLNNYLSFSSKIVEEFPDEKQNFYYTGVAIFSLKYLIKIKDFSNAKQILESFTFYPSGKTDTEALEKIKYKVYLKVIEK